MTGDPTIRERLRELAEARPHRQPDIDETIVQRTDIRHVLDELDTLERRAIAATDLLRRLGRPEQLPQTYTSMPLDPTEPGVRKNSDGTAFEQHYYRYLVGTEDVEAIEAALEASRGSA